MRRRQMAGMAAIALGAAAAGAWWRIRGLESPPSGGAALPQPGAQAPAAAGDFWSHTVERPDGSPLALARFRGRPLLVNFWATWCPPCIREMPLIDNFARSQGASGWQVLGLAIDKREAVADFLRKQPVSYAIGLAGFEGSQWSRDLGNATGALPFTVVFDAQGQVRQRKLGEVSAAELAAWVKA